MVRLERAGEGRKRRGRAAAWRSAELRRIGEQAADRVGQASRVGDRRRSAAALSSAA